MNTGQLNYRKEKSTKKFVDFYYQKNLDNLKKIHLSHQQGEELNVIVIPSMSFDQKLLEGIVGIEYYESRSLWEVLRVKESRVFVTFITIKKINRLQIDHLFYCANLSQEEINRVTFFSLEENGSFLGKLSLTEGILKNTEIFQQVKLLSSKKSSYIESFLMTKSEEELSRQLDIPIWWAHPDLNFFQSKSGNRVLLEDQLPMPYGHHSIYSEGQLILKISDIWLKRKYAKRIVVKLNHGVSGDGNAILDRAISVDKFINFNINEKISHVRSRLQKMKFFLKSLNYGLFIKRLVEEGAIVEEFIEGKQKYSPSVQVMVNCTGAVELLSSHEQILDSEGMRFLGSNYPASNFYRKEIEELGIKAGECLLKNDIYGIFSIDFLVTQKNNKYEISVIEINIRKGGTTHPYWTSKLLLDACRSEESGCLIDNQGREYVYRSNDNFEKQTNNILSLDEILNGAKEENLIFNLDQKEGVIFHLLSAWRPLGKIGYTIIAKNSNRLDKIQEQIEKIFDSPSNVAW